MEAEYFRIHLDFLRQLVAIEPQFQDFIDDETDGDDPDYQVGTYLVMGNIARWVAKHSDHPSIPAILNLLEFQFPDGDAEIQWFIGIGFFESAPIGIAPIFKEYKYLHEFAKYADTHGVIFSGPFFQMIAQIKADD